jgi:hypothetical protein
MDGIDGMEGMPTEGRGTDGSLEADAAFLSFRGGGGAGPLPPFDSGVAGSPK